ncbi:DUF3139 domain-containing protein [Priestia koreensis]|uniref:DUF3139 domain-containing protein n=1 Tax=Priestia koreensis TaxID=284581 RepID=UPI001F57CA89|nr:DUF3139 domain-containing protein [Priestia koreensis]UNL83198.1 DUF3139 domain-containing protein [Priestia koreensis]
MAFLTRKMVKLTSIILGIIVALCVMILTPVGYVIYALNNGDPYENYVLDKYVPSYLTEQGYEEKDIKEKIITYLGGNDSYFESKYRVEFNDEPGVYYFYAVKLYGKQVSQLCFQESIYDPSIKNHIPETGLHKEKNCTSR